MLPDYYSYSCPCINYGYVIHVYEYAKQKSVIMLNLFTEMFAEMNTVMMRVS